MDEHQTDQAGTPQGHAPALDGLRGAAAMLVFLSHAALAGVPLVRGIDLAGMGKPGVYLFFVLSAFLLTRNALAAGAEAYRPAALRRYALRRVARIYPAFAAYLLFAFAATQIAGLFSDSPRVSPFPLDLGGLIGHLALARGDGVTWSIAVEFKYYLALPLVAWALWRARLSGRWTLAALSLALLGGAAAAELRHPPGLNDMRLAPYLTLFVSGGLLAAWSQGDRRQPAALAGFAGGAGLLGVALTTPSLHGWIIGAEVPSDQFHGDHMLFAALWCAVLFGVLRGPAPLSGLSRSRAARAMGRISFSFYLWHVVAISVAKAAAPALGLLAGPAALCGALALAAISYALFEKGGVRQLARYRGGLNGVIGLGRMLRN